MSSAGRAGPVTSTRRLDADDAAFVAAARLRAARDQPYMAAALFAMVPVSTPGHETFSVDARWRLYVDMATAREWGVAGTAAVLLHEAHHLVRDHHRRAVDAGALEADAHNLWNYAADAAINDDLVADGQPLPDPLLPHHLDAPPHRTEEWYFEALLQRVERQRSRPCGSGAGGARLEIELDDDATDHEGPVGGLDDVDAVAVRRAVAHSVLSSDQTHTPSPGLQRWADELLHPQVQWRTLLRAAVRREVRAITGEPHPTWSRPDRRANAWPDVLRPGVRRCSAEVAVVIDTSGSMTRRLLDAAVTEIDALLHRAGVSELTVVFCDVEAVTPQRVRRVAALQLSGGGGTDLRVGIAAAVELKPTPAIIIVLTDGLTPWPPRAPGASRLICVLIGEDAPLPTGSGITSIRIKGEP